MKRLLNAQGYHFVRLNPSKHGLTGCTVGLIDRRMDTVLQYAIESAHKAYNAGSVWFMRVNDATKG